MFAGLQCLAKTCSFVMSRSLVLPANLPLMNISPSQDARHWSGRDVLGIFQSPSKPHWICSLQLSSLLSRHFKVQLPPASTFSKVFESWVQTSSSFLTLLLSKRSEILHWVTQFSPGKEKYYQIDISLIAWPPFVFWYSHPSLRSSATTVLMQNNAERCNAQRYNTHIAEHTYVYRSPFFARGIHVFKSNSEKSWVVVELILSLPSRFSVSPAQVMTRLPASPIGSISTTWGFNQSTYRLTIIK